MNRFELWDKVARNWQYRWQQPFRSVVALCSVYVINNDDNNFLVTNANAKSNYQVETYKQIKCSH